MDIKTSTRHSGIAGALILAVLLASVAALIIRSQNNAYANLDERAHNRVETAAGFLESYVAETLERETSQAELAMGGSGSQRAAFEDLTQTFGFHASLLLDASGKVMEVWPRKPELIGTKIADEYAHLSAAVTGSPAISNVVPSAAEGVPVAAFAAPFRSSDGLRVFSGAIDVNDSPIGHTYLSSFSPVKGNRVYVVDQAGMIVASSEAGGVGALADADAALAEVIASKSSGHYDRDGEVESFYSSTEISGTPWHLVMSTPTHELYAPLNGLERFAPWLVFGAFALAGLVVLWLLARTRRQAQVLEESNHAMTRKNEEVGALAEQLRELTLIDPLTGARNRRGFESIVDLQMKRAAREATDLHVLFVDIDDMKMINDSYGHAAGDRAITAVAHTLMSVCREADVVGRLGGDEFAVALSVTDTPEVIMRRIAAAMAEVGRSADHPYPLEVSIGLATCTSDGERCLEGLIAQADRSMYADKDRRRPKVLALVD